MQIRASWENVQLMKITNFPLFQAELQIPLSGGKRKKKMKIKSLLTIFIINVALINSMEGQNCIKKIFVESDYSCLEITFTVKMDCTNFVSIDSSFFIEDSSVLSLIKRELLSLKENSKYYSPDVRIKTTIYYNSGESYVLCFGEAPGSMLYMGKVYEYNYKLAEIILAQIRKRLSPAKLNL